MYDRFTWPNKIYKRQIKKFKELMRTFCRQNHIAEDFESFLNYQWNGFYSPGYVYLYMLPHVYLVNSKCFIEYYNNLDPDFKQDVITKQEFKSAQQQLQKNKKMQEYLKKVMKDDSIL